jgi:PAS domain S-box-containing protein
MTATTLLICALALLGLYRDAGERHRQRLVETAGNQARLIETIAHHESISIHHSDETRPNDTALRRIAAAHAELELFGETGESILAYRDGDLIVFLSSQRQSNAGPPPPVPFEGDWAEPMRRALSGASGVVTALDYRGVEVLAAYEPIAALDLGLVTKIDRSEVLRPFIQATLIAGAAALLLAFVSSLLFFHAARPFQRALRHQAETFQILAETSREGIILADTRGIIRFVNRAAEKLFGFARGELLGEPVTRLMPAEHARMHDGYIRRYLQTGMSRIMGTGRQSTAVRKDGSRFPIYLSLGDINTSQDRLFAGVILDISEQQQLQREILEIPVSEQRRIGQELHDGLGQQLTGLGMLATSLLNKASKPDHQLASQLATGLQDAIAQLRAVSRGLVPVDIDAEGFIGALEDLVLGIREKTGMRVVFECSQRVRVSDNTGAMHLYRIAQEAINNALKHAGAKLIEVSVGMEGNRGYLSIRDDGSGFEYRPDNVEGLGLRIMRHRCGLIDADLEVNTTWGEGTEIKCYFGLDDNR